MVNWFWNILSSHVPPILAIIFQKLSICRHQPVTYLGPCVLQPTLAHIRKKENVFWSSCFPAILYLPSPKSSTSIELHEYVCEYVFSFSICFCFTFICDHFLMTADNQESVILSQSLFVAIPLKWGGLDFSLVALQCLFVFLVVFINTYLKLYYAERNAWRSLMKLYT